MHKSLIRYHLLIIALLFVSLFIYVFYRSEKTIVNEWLLSFFSRNQFESIKNAVSLGIPLPDWVIYSLPEGCWIAAVSLASKPFSFRLGKMIVPCIVFPLIYCVGLELLQLAHITNGRFDWFDIALAVVGWLVAYRWIKWPGEEVHVFRKFDLQTAFLCSNYLILYLSCVSR